ncbi:uncharacterized protein CDAR_39691 [Caerostris darwini]|uniref:Uncharacterized protein n=1 Tax=Caerostris darwini TaxID=1538125 RepID=A0AAV4U6F4_9ARAC|nr:uncharacterized protein CDAR_39691 [Caerostris darwini]
MFAQAAAYGTEMILARALVIRRRLRALSKLPFSNGCNRLLIKAPSLPHLRYNYCSVSLITGGSAYCSATAIKGGSEDLIKSLVGLPGPCDNSPEEDLSEIFGCGFPFSQCGRNNFRSLANGHQKEVIIDGFLRSSEKLLCYPNIY